MLESSCGAGGHRTCSLPRHKHKMMINAEMQSALLAQRLGFELGLTFSLLPEVFLGSHIVTCFLFFYYLLIRV